MKSKITTWFQGLGRRCRRPHRDHEAETSQSQDEIVKLPYLTATRPSALTPSSSTEALPSAGSPFFERLPRELRREILLIAFGCGTVHMELSFKHPVAPPENGRVLLTHAGVNTNPPATIRGPKSWQWWSCVCHRTLPGSEKTVILRYNPNSRLGVDGCVRGYADCRDWPGSCPAKCKIGIMGWLLTCRQAYTEGIDVLYRTNTIHMSGSALILNLPRLLPPQRLSDITSIEIIYQLRRSRDAARVPEVDCLHSYLDALRSSLPNLSKLRLALRRSNDLTLPVDMRPVLEVLDAFALETNLTEFVVSSSAMCSRRLTMLLGLILPPSNLIYDLE